MKKRFLLATALLTTLCVSGSPMTAEASGNCRARAIVIQPNGNCCNTISQQDLYNLLEEYFTQNYLQLQIQWPNSNPVVNAPSADESCEACAPSAEEPCEDCTPAVEKPCEDCTAPTQEPVTEQPVERPAEQAPENATVQVNATYEEQVVALVNAERAKEGLPALTVDEKLQSAALARAKETVQLFSHTRPNGTSCFTILKEYGISYRSAGENIAYGQRSPEEVVTGWMNSPGHRANIMNQNFTKIGIGYYQAPNGVKYWSQLFLS